MSDGEEIAEHRGRAATGQRLLLLGVKTDPIEYRYSYEWLFRLLAEEDVRIVQIGTFFEIYQLPDDYFLELKVKAEDCGVRIGSVFTAHRELGGFFRDDGPGWEEVARRNFERLIHVAALLGATSVGSNPGSAVRDRMGTKPSGVRRYLNHFKELLHVAHGEGIEWLTMEPMSCLAEPPALAAEIEAFGREIAEYHAANADRTARPGLCVDVAHGYVDVSGAILEDHWRLLRAGLPWTAELHLKNTDGLYSSTFGFTEADRKRGIVDIAACRQFYLDHAETLPVKQLVGYFEVGGPKLGRDYSDLRLGDALRESLRYLKATWAPADGQALKQEPAARGGDVSPPSPAQASVQIPAPRPKDRPSPWVLLAPSIMCADLCHLEDSVRRLEAVGVDCLHFDLMDTHFTPNMPLGLGTIEQLRPKTGLPFDAHLMVETNDLLIRELGKIGVQFISVHAESCTHLDRSLALIRDQGAKAGVALNPATPLHVLDYVLERLDFVVVMTVNPGFAGQKLVPGAIRKIAACRQHLDSHGCHVPIEVDGNVSFDHIPAMVAAGADILVAGTSSLFHRASGLVENAAKTRAAVALGLARRGPAPGVEQPHVRV